MGEIFFLLTCGFLGVSLARSIGVGRPLSDAVTGIALAIYLLCLWVPARLQEAGLVKSKIHEANLMAPPDAMEISELCWRWSIELLVVYLAQRVAWSGSWRKNASSHAGGSGLFRPEATALVLLAIGAIATVIFQTELDERAAGGQGIQTLLKSCMLCGLAVVTFYRFFGRKVYVLLVIGGIAFLILMGIRSPLFVVFFSYLTSELLRNRFRSVRRLLLVGSLSALLAIVGSVMSAVRGNVIRNTGVPVSEAIGEALADPWLAPFEAGLDTLDGYRVSALIEPHLPAKYSDLLNIFTTFVPRAIWPDKPTDLVVEIGTTYLGYKGSGQYLSPIGYLSIVFDGYGMGLVALGVFALLAALLLRIASPRFWCAIILCVVFRFFLGGSSFDIYYGLTLALPILVVQGALCLSDPHRLHAAVGTEQQKPSRR